MKESALRILKPLFKGPLSLFLSFVFFIFVVVCFSYSKTLAVGMFAGYVALKVYVIST